MAVARAKCHCKECGCDFIYTKADCYNRSDANSFEEWASANIDLCSSCLARLKAEEASAKAAEELENGPELTGSEKQVQWALNIRAKAREMYLSLDRYLKNEKGKLKYARLWDYVYSTKTTARWWIDHREIAQSIYSAQDVLKGCLGECDEYTARQDRASELASTEAKPAVEEAMLRPENGNGKAAVEIDANESFVGAEYDRDDDFIAAAKDAGMHWDSGARKWQLRICDTTGPWRDRATELAVCLLRAGFTVILWDDKVRGMTIRGEFAPRIRRWVSFDAEAARLVLSWERGNDALYSVIKRIQGAKYSHGAFYLPLRQWRAVEDAATAYGFAYTDGATRAIAAYKAEEMAALMVTPPAPPAEPKQPEAGLAGLIDDCGLLPDLVDSDAT